MSRRGLFGALAGVLAVVAVATGVGVTTAPAPAALVASADPLAGVAVVAGPDPAAEAAWDAAGRHARTTYFGSPWIDTDHNGCPTDQDIARRDATGWTALGRCDSTGGSILDYEGRPVPRAPRAWQLDHVIAVHSVYVLGGARLDQATRIRIANDSDNLIYTSTHDNESKGDDTASQYLPPDPAARCRYVHSYVAVVHRYGLAVTTADAAALRRALAGCPA